MKKVYLRENEILHSRPSNNIEYVFRFDGADICLMEWDTLLDEHDKVVKADENGYYTECYGDEGGECPNCKNTKCPDAGRYVRREKAITAEICIDREYPAFCTVCPECIIDEEADLSVPYGRFYCRVYQLYLEKAQLLDTAIRCPACMGEYPITMTNNI